MTGGIARIDVGTEHIPFDIHIELLCEYSAFFNEHFKDRCTQVVSGTVHLRDCDHDLFTEFVNLLYRGKIFENETRLEWMELIRLWVLGSELGAFLLQNIVIDRCEEKYNTDKSAMGADAIDYAYENTTIGCPLRGMIVDIWSSTISSEQFLLQQRSLPHAFLIDSCLNWITRKANDNSDYLSLSTLWSRYHVSSEDQPFRRGRMTPPPHCRDSSMSPVRHASAIQMTWRRMKQPRLPKDVYQTPTLSEELINTGSGSSETRPTCHKPALDMKAPTHVRKYRTGNMH